MRYLQLAHKVRDPETGRPRDTVLYHFSRADQIDQPQLNRLIKSISRFLEPEHQALVQASLDGIGGDLSVQLSLAYGGSYALDHVWKRLELDKALGDVLADCNYAADIGRLLIFDTTTAYFEIEQADSEEDGLRQYGRPSKDHRPDLPQVVIGLAVTRDGIPVRCWTWPGNTADASVVQHVQQDLAEWQLSRVVCVVDRGFAGEEQRRAVQRGGGHVIMGERLRSAEKAVQEALSRPGRYQTIRDNLEVQEVVIEEGSQRRRFVVVRNPRQAETDRLLRRAVVERTEAEIRRLDAQLEAGRRGAGHTKAVCALKANASAGRFVRELKSGQLRLGRAAVREDERYDGKYLLSTTDPSLSAEDVALGYKQLQDVERGFRTLKHTLELRPMHHPLPERIRAHVLLCWLALLLIRVIESETGQTWVALRDDLERIPQVKLASKDGAFVSVTELDAE